MRAGRDFFIDDAVTIARRLPGMEIVMQSPEGDISRYMITETEAYLGYDDKACHASKGRTKRNEVMFAEGGCLYVYFIYGMYWMMNVVTGTEDDPQAVLIRGAAPFSGPGRLTRAIGVDGSYNGEDLTLSERIWLEDTGIKPELASGPRIGIDYAGEPWISKPWRFLIKEHIKSKI